MMNIEEEFLSFMKQYYNSVDRQSRQFEASRLIFYSGAFISARYLKELTDVISTALDMRISKNNVVEENLAILVEGKYGKKHE
jgi:hypothetical protein